MKHVSILRSVIIFAALSLVGCVSHSIAESVDIYDNYFNNEESEYQDMLTPEYYHARAGDPFRDEVNRFVNYARQESFHHPLEDKYGKIPEYSVPNIGAFGAAKGPNRNLQHHAAVDLHVMDRETNVDLYAAHDGFATTVRDTPKYRHVLMISKDIEDNRGQVIGKLVTLYAHIDLDLDEEDSLFLDGQYINRGDLVSRHLYAETMGGPHLHFEIRYYRLDDLGNETFYGGNSGPFGNPDFTELSAGIWSYGYWHPDIGYGFADPRNHGVTLEYPRDSEQG